MIRFLICSNGCGRRPQRAISTHESLADAYWQPWQPETGLRVRVRLSGECRILAEPGSFMWRLDSERGGHFPWEDGLLGRVYNRPEGLRDWQVQQGHTINVLPDDQEAMWNRIYAMDVAGVLTEAERGFYRNGVLFYLDYAPAELEPLEES